VYIPYRALTPVKVDNMLVACRWISADAAFREYINLIPHCMAFGQAAGTAAALAVKSGMALRKVNIEASQVSLCEQGVSLPNRAQISYLGYTRRRSQPLKADTKRNFLGRYSHG
jgi:hypothetical protein